MVVSSLECASTLVHASSPLLTRLELAGSAELTASKSILLVLADFAFAGSSRSNSLELVLLRLSGASADIGTCLLNCDLQLPVLG